MSAAIVPVPRTPVTVRPATPADLPFIDSLQKRHSKQVGWMPMKSLEQKIASGHVLALDRSGDDALVEIVEQAFDQQALAAAVIGGDNAEPGIGPQRMAHELQRPQVLIAWEKERLVVRVGERWGREAEAHGLV